MYVYRGTVEDVARLVVQPDFVEACARRFGKLFGLAPAEEEVRSWRQSWPALLDVLVRAGLGELDVLLEYSLPATGERVDAVIVGQDADGVLTVVAVELKQWTYARPAATPGKLEVGGREVAHPARQVGGYVYYLRDWVAGGAALRVRGTVLLHNAPAELIGGLRGMVPADAPSAEFPLLGRGDLAAGVVPEELAARTGCGGLTAAREETVAAFLAAEHRPSQEVLNRLAENISGNNLFPLIGEQDQARQAILRAVAAVGGTGPGGMVVVTGGPGTGKTAIAGRLMGELCGQPGRNPRLLTPSGTLTKQLQRLLGESSRGLVTTFLDSTPTGLDKRSVILLDEAHRARTYPNNRRTAFPLTLSRVLDRVGVLVLFLDERQIVRPSEGITLNELRRHAQETGAAFEHVDLVTQFRCNGSQAYFQWVDQMFSPMGQAAPWTGENYDLALSSDPDELAAWVDDHTAAGHSARITAGFCWPWERPSVPPLIPEVALKWVDADGRDQSWARPWNLRSDEPLPAFPNVPARPYWATDPGGHEQVGCIYTAQGLEYGFGAVIVGDDLVRRNGRWLARPEASHDTPLKGLTSDQYLPYALNTYRVLATRGARATRFYSTDMETQAYLAASMPRA
ncbi:DNA/RNA helicase domain-containing protein [Kitasatospora sp. NPDC088779]|uniref:DNA/RNA helicase domain-containing protein n=1 Tax=Kitasatospora sp. NPDC088779 TaxID=3154964 RepID=UPI003436A928